MESNRPSAPAAPTARGSVTQPASASSRRAGSARSAASLSTSSAAGGTAARIELLYVIVFAAAILTVLYQGADFAFLPSVVEQHQLVDANGKIAASQSANEVGGRGLGGC